MRTTREQPGRFDRWVLVATLAVTALAIRQELAKPARERVWHGLLFGWLPYDFRRPTIQRVRDTFWAPGDRRLFVRRFFGLGWDVNLARVLGLVRGQRDVVGQP